MSTTSPSLDVPDTGLAARGFKPGPGFYVLVCLIVLTIVLALSAAITSALGVTGTSRVLGGTALILVGLGMLASLRVSARSLVVNAPPPAPGAQPGPRSPGPAAGRIRQECQERQGQGGQGPPVFATGLGA